MMMHPCQKIGMSSFSVSIVCFFSFFLYRFKLAALSMISSLKWFDTSCRGKIISSPPVRVES